MLKINQLKKIVMFLEKQEFLSHLKSLKKTSNYFIAIDVGATNTRM